ncbi:nuclear transport factor 2 family protein [Yinghuangia seranimata]|uniref:nuclear transport factor 2 family protein n=1 Tax=Yinghuangia seranimata TaxID=408067 RepID=UPI00248AD229|nr:nuclear transport factor 2 family protein [Yinghuangia seranimata]MDI2125820.1 nuclear transport factor 2 family protein [Yinghuangia seranimata]
MTTNTATDPKSVVIRYVEAVRNGDLPVVRDSFAEDATWLYPGETPWSKVWRGRDEIVDGFLGGAGARFVPGSMVIGLTNVIADGDQVVAEWTSDALSAEGVEYHNRCLGVFVVRDGRIAEVREYADTQHTARVLFP